MANKTDKILRRLRAGDFLHTCYNGLYHWDNYDAGSDAIPFKAQTDRLVALGKAKRVPASDGCAYHVVAAVKEEGK